MFPFPSCRVHILGNLHRKAQAASAALSMSRSERSDMERVEERKSAQTFGRFGAARPSQFRSQQGQGTVVDPERNPGVGFAVDYRVLGSIRSAPPNFL